MNNYDKGDTVHLTAAFTNAAGTPADPTVTTFSIEEPDGTETTYTYPTNAQLVRDSAGAFHVDYIPDQSGTHHYRFAGTGAVGTIEQGAFFVRESRF